MAFPEREITVTSVVREVGGGVALVEATAEQGGKAIIRTARAEVALD
jgi:hypothetical protein